MNVTSKNKPTQTKFSRKIHGKYFELRKNKGVELGNSTSIQKKHTINPKSVTYKGRSVMSK